MPGISILFNSNEKKIGDGNNVKEMFSNALNSLMYNDSYNQELFLGEDKRLIGCTRYPEYPIHISENKEFWICLEGKIYDKNMASISDEIFALIKQVFNERTTIQENRINPADWLLSKDGDFIIYALDKINQDFVIINDVLGRLPFYYYNENGTIIASREIQFLSQLIDNFHLVDYKFDKVGMAELLLFCHTLGKRTLLKSVNRLEPASLLRIQKDDLKNNFKVHVENIYSFNFEEKRNASISIEDNARELTSLFLEACNNRADHSSKNIISLSGGFDSRAVAAALYRNKIKSYAVTSPEPNWRPVVGNSSETEVAKKLASTMNIECENYDVMIPKAENLLTLLRIKNGLVYLGHGFLPRFLEELKDKHRSSPINFFTGHGGDISFTNLSFNVLDVDRWVRSILRVKGHFPLHIIAALTKINETELIDELRNILSSYPEEDLSLKNAHFLFFENNAKLSFEIEDVNRFYFWSVAPFYSVPFFKYIFNCSDKSKEKLALFREFLFAISPAAAAISNSDWGCSILSKKFKILQHILYLSFKHRKLRRFIKKIYDKRAYNYKDSSNIIQCIREQVKHCNKITNFLAADILEKILDDSTRYSHEGIDNLLTITSLIEQRMCNRSTLNKYY